MANTSCIPVTVRTTNPAGHLPMAPEKPFRCEEAAAVPPRTNPHPSLGVVAGSLPRGEGTPPGMGLAARSLGHFRD